MASEPNYANENRSFLNISSNPRKNHFHHTVAKYVILTAVPSKKYCKCQNIKYLKNVPESRDSCKISTAFSSLKDAMSLVAVMHAI